MGIGLSFVNDTLNTFRVSISVGRVTVATRELESGSEWTKVDGGLSASMTYTVRCEDLTSSPIFNGCHYVHRKFKQRIRAPALRDTKRILLSHLTLCPAISKLTLPDGTRPEVRKTQPKKDCTGGPSAAIEKPALIGGPRPPEGPPPSQSSLSNGQRIKKKKKKKPKKDTQVENISLEDFLEGKFVENHEDNHGQESDEDEECWDASECLFQVDFLPPLLRPEPVLLQSATKVLESIVTEKVQTDRDGTVFTDGPRDIFTIIGSHYAFRGKRGRGQEWEALKSLDPTVLTLRAAERYAALLYLYQRETVTRLRNACCIGGISGSNDGETSDVSTRGGASTATTASEGGCVKPVIMGVHIDNKRLCAWLSDTKMYIKNCEEVFRTLTKDLKPRKGMALSMERIGKRMRLQRQKAMKRLLLGTARGFEAVSREIVQVLAAQVLAPFSSRPGQKIFENLWAAARDKDEKGYTRAAKQLFQVVAEPLARKTSWMKSKEQCETLTKSVVKGVVQTYLLWALQMAAGGPKQTRTVSSEGSGRSANKPTRAPPTNDSSCEMTQLRHSHMNTDSVLSRLAVMQSCEVDVYGCAVVVVMVVVRDEEGIRGVAKVGDTELASFALMKNAAAILRASDSWEIDQQYPGLLSSCVSAERAQKVLRRLLRVSSCIHGRYADESEPGRAVMARFNKYALTMEEEAERKRRILVRVASEGKLSQTKQQQRQRSPIEEDEEPDLRAFKIGSGESAFVADHSFPSMSSRCSST
eukprot:jgi/Bigna1/75096/fgenesh1_pg.32_\